MTTCGYGDVFPTTWYARLVVTAQMLISVLYSVVILGYGLSQFRYVCERRDGGEK